MIPFVYSSSDSGAPIVSGGDMLSIHKLLKGCLVDGYPDHPGAGWTLEYTGTDPNAGVADNSTVYCFRQGGGQGRYLQVGASYARNFSAGSNSYQNFSATLIRVFDSMTSATEGLGRMPDINSTWTTAGNASGEYGFVFSVGSPLLLSPQKRWKIVADNKFFYLMIEAGTPPSNVSQSSGARTWEFYFFGDFKSDLNGDYFNTILRCTKNIDAANHAYNNSASVQYKNYYPMNTNGGISPFFQCGANIDPNFGILIRGNAYATGYNVPANMWYAGQRTQGSTTYDTWASSSSSQYPNFEDISGATNSIRLSAVRVLESSPQQNRVLCRGRLPGFFAPLSSNPWDNWQTLRFNGGEYAGVEFLTVNLNDPIGAPGLPGPCSAIAINCEWDYL